MRKWLGLSVLIVGTIVGAGFASGRELIAFFGKSISLWVVPVVGVCFFLLSVLFLVVGNKLKKTNISDVNSVFLGRLHYIADFFLLLNSLVMLAGMLSAMDTLLSMVYPLAPFYSLISGVLCAIVASKGLRAILKCNAFIVPLVVAVLVIVCMLNISEIRNPAPFNSFSIGAALIYVSMNMMLACTFFITIHNLKMRTIILGSLVAAIVLSGLMFLLIVAITNGNVTDAKMPMLELAKKLDPRIFYIGIIVIMLSIFTTMITAMNTLKIWVKSFGAGEVFSITVVLLAGLIVSNLGFENVVGYLYPAIGTLGILYIIIIVIYTIKSKRKQNLLPLKTKN